MNAEMVKKPFQSTKGYGTVDKCSTEGRKLKKPLQSTKGYGTIDKCSTEGRKLQTVVSDLSGVLIRMPNPFCYFLLVSLEASGVIRSLFLILAAPLACFLYHCVSAASALKLMIYISMSGLKASEIEGVARAVLPRFFLQDLNPEAWNVVSSFGKKVIVTALPRVFVEAFAVEYMGVDRVIGTEIEVDAEGKATGFVVESRVLAGLNKKDAVQKLDGDFMADVGVGKYNSTGHFLSLCKEAMAVGAKEK